MSKDYSDQMTKVLGVAKVHANNKLTIPKELRQFLGIEDGCYVKFVLDGSQVVMRKLEP